MVNVTPPFENSDGVDGFACLDEDAQYASICLGGNYTGNVDVQVNGIPSAFGSNVNVKVEYVEWTNKDTTVFATTTVSNTVYPVSSGKITVPVNITNPLYGYRVYVSSEFITSVQTEKDNVSIYPNPADNVVACTFPELNTKSAEVSLYDLNGKLVKHAHIDRGNNTLCLSGLESGLYVLKLNYNNKVVIRKMIKR